MGYPMAINLRTKMDATAILYVYDVSESAISRFQRETGGMGTVKVVRSGFEAVQAAVSQRRVLIRTIRLTK